MSRALVLCYHAVSETWESELAVTPVQLERQVGSLLRRGYEPTTFLDAVTGPARRPALAITFDDAYASVLTAGLPVLRKLGAVASVYVPTNWADRSQPMRWPGIEQWLGTRHERELLPLSWAQLRELVALGWEVGSHTRSHPRLTELDDERLAAELAESRDACSTGLGTSCETLAYPYGDVDARVVAAAAAAGYRAAGALPRAPHRTEPLRWPRVGVYRWDGPSRFRLKASPLVGRLRALPLRRALDPIGRLVRSRPSG